MPGKTLSPDEVRLAKQWAIEGSEPPSEIARRLGRNKSTITRFLKHRLPPKRRGNKVVSSAASVAHGMTYMCNYIGFHSSGSTRCGQTCG